MELRQEIDVYNRIYTDVVYPKQKLMPELKRTAYKYKKALYSQKLLDLFCILLTSLRLDFPFFKICYIQYKSNLILCFIAKGTRSKNKEAVPYIVVQLLLTCFLKVYIDDIF